jgi:tetratricopeptide (TPR) repeat protein
MALLSAAVDRATEGFPTITLIGGEAGIGKSRLVHELIAGARARDVQTLSGGCVGLDSGEIPYGPIVAALRGAGAGNVATAAEGLEPSVRAELARAMPELGVPLADAAEPERGAQSRLFELLLGLLRGLADEVTTVVVIEDIHWADPSTRDFVRYFCARASSEHVALIATFRSDELSPRDPLRALLAELARSPRVMRLELARLTRAQVAVLLGEILDAQPQPALVDEIFARSQGNPFFAEELLAMAGTGPGAELPASLRDALMVRVDSLSETARTALRFAAVAGRAVDHTLLRAGTGAAESELARALREAVTAHVLVPAGEELCFRHELVREVVYADLLAAERSYLHRRVATALAEIGGSSNPAELGHHWQAAGEARLALAAYVDAGLGAVRAYAFRDALGHFEHAIELWPRAGESGERAGLDRAGLFAHAAEAAWSAGDVEPAAALCRQALDEVDPVADPLRAAAMHERLGRYSTSKPMAALACYARALELLPPGPSAQRARLLGRQGLALTYLDRWAESRRRCEEAVEIAQAAGARAEEAHAMSTLGVALTFLGRPLEGEPMLRRALAIASELGRADDVARAHISLAEVLRYLGRLADALEVALDGERTARSVGLEYLFGTYLSLSAADDLLHLGRWEEASRRVAAVDPEGLERTSRELWLSVAGRLAVMRGDAPTALAHLEVASALCSDGRPEQVPFVYGGLAELALWQGRPDRARRLVAAGLELVAGSVDALNTPVLLAIGVRAETEAGLRDGDAARRVAVAAATALTARIECLLDVEEGTSCPPQGRGHLATSVAELTRLTHEPAIDPWAKAADAWEEIAHPYPAAYARLRMAEAAAFRGERSAARRELTAALDVAVGLGAGFLIREGERLCSALDLAGWRPAEPF